MNWIERYSLILGTIACYTGLLIPLTKWLHIRYKSKEKDERIKFLEELLKEIVRKK